MSAWFDIVARISNILIPIATVITLLLVYFQIRQTSFQTEELRKSINSATYQGITENERAIWDYLSRDEEFTRKYFSGMGYKIPDGMTASQMINIMLIIGYEENLFYQYKRGALPEVLWQGWKNYFRAQANEPMFRAVWDQYKNWYWTEFVQFIEEQMKQSKD